MPTYEYRCRACGHGFDIVQSFKDESLTICPACGGELRKVYGAPMISFKGSGFYATDNRKSTKSGSEGDHKGDQKSDQKSEASSNDTKKDAKKEDSSSANTVEKKRDKQPSTSPKKESKET
jgi:putative FmdB family regulatory protein